MEAYIPHMPRGSKRRRRRLRRLKIHEVSFVDRPANEIPFLFYKRAEAVPVAKATDLKVTFSTKGTPDETEIEVNGRTLSEVRGFALSYNPIGDTIGLGCSYTIGAKGESRGGFKASRTYSLYKGEMAEQEKEKTADDADLDVLQKCVGEIDEDIDGDLARQLAEQAAIVELYKADMPEDLMDAFRRTIRLASETEEVRKDEDKVTDEPKAQEINLDELAAKTAEAMKPIAAEAAKTAVMAERDAAASAAAKEAEEKAAADAAEADATAAAAKEAAEAALAAAKEQEAEGEKEEIEFEDEAALEQSIATDAMQGALADEAAGT